MAKARETARRRYNSKRPNDSGRDGQQRDSAALERELVDLRAAIADADLRRKEMQSKLVKTEKENVRLQKLVRGRTPRVIQVLDLKPTKCAQVSDVLVEQKPELAQELRKLSSWKARVRTLEAEKKKLSDQVSKYESDVKVQTARQLKDEVTAYQLELERLRSELSATQKEAEENARIARLARKKVAKTKQRTEMQTKRQTERVLAARHSADLGALAKQSRLLKRCASVP
eukprot:SAG31_NODE_35_length_31836_cov_10.841352_34_plen_230_part_00